MGKGFSDSHRGLGIIHSQPFLNIIIFVNIILYALSFFISFIAKGLEMCRLGGVISAQKVLF